MCSYHWSLNTTLLQYLCFLMCMTAMLSSMPRLIWIGDVFADLPPLLNTIHSSTTFFIQSTLIFILTYSADSIQKVTISKIPTDIKGFYFLTLHQLFLTTLTFSSSQIFMDKLPYLKLYPQSNYIVN